MRSIIHCSCVWHENEKLNHPASLFCGNTLYSYFLGGSKPFFKTSRCLAVDNHRSGAKSVIIILWRSYLQLAVVLFSRDATVWLQRSQESACILLDICRIVLEFPSEAPHIRRVKEKMRREGWRESDGASCCRGAAVA